MIHLKTLPLYAIMNQSELFLLFPMENLLQVRTMEEPTEFSSRKILTNDFVLPNSPSLVSSVR
jgi:hypothetical protein